jgi:hypothetical protein
MDEWNKQHGLSDLSVGETDPTWESRLLVDDDSSTTYCLQLFVALPED